MRSGGPNGSVRSPSLASFIRKIMRECHLHSLTVSVNNRHLRAVYPAWPHAPRPPAHSSGLHGLGVACGGVAGEARLALAEPELDLAGGAVAVLGQAQVDDLAVRALVFAGLLLLAPEEEDQVRVLLDGAGPPPARGGG